MKTVALLSVLTIALLLWEGLYAKRGTVSRLAKDGGLASLYEWRDKSID